MVEEKKFPHKKLSKECIKNYSQKCIDEIFANAKVLNQYIRSNPKYKGPHWKDAPNF